MLLFLDDFLPAPNYCAVTEAVIAARPDCVVTTGTVLADGANAPRYQPGRGPGDPGTGQLLCRAIRSPLRRISTAMAATWPYACDVVRKHGIRVDEALPLYAWYEDIDFTRLVGRHGDLAGWPAPAACISAPSWRQRRLGAAIRRWRTRSTWRARGPIPVACPAQPAAPYAEGRRPCARPEPWRPLRPLPRQSSRLGRLGARPALARHLELEAVQDLTFVISSFSAAAAARDGGYLGWAALAWWRCGGAGAGAARPGRNRLLGLLALLPLDQPVLRPLEDRFPRPAAEPAHIDGIVVLGGAVEQRLTEALWPAGAERRGRADDRSRRAPPPPPGAGWLVFTGGTASLAPGALSEADVARQLWLDLGVPPGRMGLRAVSATRTRMRWTPSAWSGRTG